MAVLLFAFIKKIQPFRKLALIITIYELVAVFTFFHIFSMYQYPDFMIQLLGLFVIIIAVYLIPNLWGNMLAISIAIAAGFLLCTYFTLEIGSIHFIAAVVYISIEITLCAIWAFHFNSYKKREFIARTELQEVYSTDPLTQIGNRVRLEDEAGKWIERCVRHGLNLSLVLTDVDNLKHINDEHGHLAGDVILCEIAQIMRSQLRKNDVCVRWGGDEFVLLLPKTNMEEAEKLVKRIKRAIQEYKFNIGTKVTCSFGIADLNKGGSLEQLIKQADDSMYNEKNKRPQKTNGDI